MNQTEPPTYSTHEVSKRTGATPRQLQWWDTMRVISPHRQGHARIWSSQDLLDVQLLVSLRTQGVSLQQARKVLRSARLRRRETRIWFATDLRRTFAGPDAEGALKAIARMDRRRLAIVEIPAL